MQRYFQGKNGFILNDELIIKNFLDNVQTGMYD